MFATHGSVLCRVVERRSWLVGASDKGGASYCSLHSKHVPQQRQIWAWHGPWDFQSSGYIFEAFRPERSLTSPPSLFTVFIFLFASLYSVLLPIGSLLAMGVDKTSIEYQKAHAYENRATAIIIPHVVCLVFAVTAVVLRFISRRLKAGIHLDDWVCLLALVRYSISRRRFRDTLWQACQQILCIGEDSGVLLGTIKYGSAKHVVTLKDPVAIAKVGPNLSYSIAISFDLDTGDTCRSRTLYSWYILYQDFYAHPLPPHFPQPTLPPFPLGRWHLHWRLQLRPIPRDSFPMPSRARCMAARYQIKLHSAKPRASSNGKPERSHGHHYCVPTHVHDPGPADEAGQKIAGRCFFPSRRLRMHCEHLSCADSSGNFSGWL